MAFTPVVPQPSHGPAPQPLTLLDVIGLFAVCKLPLDSAIPAWATAGDVFTVSRTTDELSVVCRQEVVPEGTHREIGAAMPASGRGDAVHPGRRPGLADRPGSEGRGWVCLRSRRSTRTIY